VDEVTQFSIFFENNKILGCRLCITSLQTLGLAFQLALKNESKETPPFGKFFIQMWPCEVQLPIFLRTKKWFLSLQTLISCNLHSEFCCNFSHIFLNWCTTRSYCNMCPKMLFFLLKFGIVIRGGNFGAIFVKT